MKFSTKNFFSECDQIRSFLKSNFIEITLRHGFSPVNLMHIFGTPFSKNTSGGLPLKVPLTLTRKITEN